MAFYRDGVEKHDVIFFHGAEWALKIPQFNWGR